MIKFDLRSALLVCVMMSLVACFGPKTPQEVTQVFWTAVVNNDVKDAVEYSTLNDAKHYDAFSKNWTGYHATWGKVEIDGDHASVASEFAEPANSGQESRKFTTYLIKRDGDWIVDYDRTKLSVNGGVLGDFLGQLGQLGDDLSKQMSASADKFRLEMDRMSKKLEQMADSFNQEATKSINKYAEELGKTIQELEDSINRALKDDDKLSDHDRQILQVASGNLEQDRKNLQTPTVEAVSNSSRNVGEVQQKLDALDGDSMTKYKQEWHDLAQEIQRDMQSMLDELSSLDKDQNS